MRLLQTLELPLGYFLFICLALVWCLLLLLFLVWRWCKLANSWRLALELLLCRMGKWIWIRCRCRTLLNNVCSWHFYWVSEWVSEFFSFTTLRSIDLVQNNRLDLTLALEYKRCCFTKGFSRYSSVTGCALFVYLLVGQVGQYKKESIAIAYLSTTTTTTPYLTLWCLSLTGLPAIKYDLGVRMGTQDSAEVVTEVVAAFWKGKSYHWVAVCTHDVTLPC